MQTYWRHLWSDSSFLALASWSSRLRAKASLSSSKTCLAAPPSSTAVEEEEDWAESSLLEYKNKTFQFFALGINHLQDNIIYSNISHKKN